MKMKWTLLQDCVAIGFIATGLLWGTARQVSVQAQQSAAPQATIGIGTVSSVPKLENGQLQTRELNGTLGEVVNRWATATTKPEWLGYSVAEVKGHRSVCCWHEGRNALDDCGSCRLEGQNYDTNIRHDNGGHGKVNLEGLRELVVLYRAESGEIGQIRFVSVECTLDAGGLSLQWLNGVKPAESVNLLESFVHGGKMESASAEKTDQGALAAIALHADPSADRAMESFVDSKEPASLRKEAAFWLGEARGAEGLRILQKMARNDPSSQVREQVSFALSLSPEPGAVPEMIRMAHDDKSSEVRGQALFWLGQKAGERAARAITGSINDDPDTEAKKKAVFALSQMPPDQGVPKLIQVAQTNRNPQIRKEAMFWLGQSEDPQALAFFEKILTQ